MRDLIQLAAVGLVVLLLPIVGYATYLGFETMGLGPIIGIPVVLILVWFLIMKLP